VTIPD